MSQRQVLTAGQMRAAEQALFDAGMTVTELMEIAAGGAAEWVRRIAGLRSVTVLCGPGNNGGDGYVIARRLREWGVPVQIVAPMPPKTKAAIKAKAAWSGGSQTSGDGTQGGVLVDCLFGSGLTRPLSGEHTLLLRDLAQRHEICVAIDVPSGIASDTGRALNERLPCFDMTLALGAWKFAHCLSEARAYTGMQKLVLIGIEPVEGAAQRVEKPAISGPSRDAHKYSRGLCAIVGGGMPGAALLSATSAMRAGAGYVKLLSKTSDLVTPAGLVRDASALATALADERIAAVLIGPGLGRGGEAKAALSETLNRAPATVLDADALHLVGPDMMERDIPVIATPHDGELDALCHTFAVVAEGRMAKAQALAKVSGMVVLAKGPDSFVAAPDGRIAIAPAAPSWLSIAGSGDVLAGIVASRLATGAAPFEAACQGVWLHTKAARLCGPAFTPEDLAAKTSDALEQCL